MRLGVTCPYVSGFHFGFSLQSGKTDQRGSLSGEQTPPFCELDRCVAGDLPATKTRLRVSRCAPLILPPHFRRRKCERSLSSRKYSKNLLTTQNRFCEASENGVYGATFCIVMEIMSFFWPEKVI
jgi:hypothetical protein